MSEQKIKYWVVMTDKFLSGWGKAENKIDKWVLECESYEEAETVHHNARARSEMKNVNIRSTKPRYDHRRYRVDYSNKDDAARMYKPHGFCNHGRCN